MKSSTYKEIISSEKIEEIRRTANIRDIVSDYVTMKKAGRNYVGLCPFHAEKTPSFHVNEEKGNFKCFGCGAGGDVFRFYMMTTGVSFPEAVREIAKRYGISLPQRPLSPRQKEKIDQKQDLYKINEDAAQYFRNQLSGSSGDVPRQYLSERAISSSCIEVFGLGYAPPLWGGLLSYLKKKGYSFDLALKAGLIRPGQREGNYYDYFRNRVMFPIQDVRGKVIGFGGRILEDGEPKYLNSPESPIYSKSGSLYGLFQAREVIQKKGHVILVEGYFDILSLFSHDIQNLVAPLGTALTRTQLQILKRYTQSIVLVFDGDEAGVKAMAKSLPLFLSEGIEARAVVLPGGQDPDDFVCEKGADAFRELIAQAPTVLDFYLRWLMQQIHPDTVEGKRQVIDQMVPHLSAVSDPISRGLYIEHVAQRVGVRSEQIATLLQNMRVKIDNFSDAHEPQKHIHDAAERDLVRIVLQHPDTLPAVARTGVLEDFQDPEITRLVPWIQICLESEGTLKVDHLIQMLEDKRLQELVAQLAYSPMEDIIDWKRTTVDCVVRIRSKKIQKELERNRTYIQEAQENGDPERVNELQMEHMDLIERRAQLQALRQNLI